MTSLTIKYYPIFYCRYIIPKCVYSVCLLAILMQIIRGLQTPGWIPLLLTYFSSKVYFITFHKSVMVNWTWYMTLCRCQYSMQCTIHTGFLYLKLEQSFVVCPLIPIESYLTYNAKANKVKYKVCLSNVLCCYNWLKLCLLSLMR